MNPRIFIESLQDNEATVVRVSYFGSRHSYAIADATGSSRRERGDAHNPELAEALATARALDSLSAKLKRRARGLMNEAENNKITRARSKERRKALETLFAARRDRGHGVVPPVDPDANVWVAIGDPVEGEPRQPPQDTAWLEMEEQQTPRDSKGRFHRRRRDES